MPVKPVRTLAASQEGYVDNCQHAELHDMTTSKRNAASPLGPKNPATCTHCLYTPVACSIHCVRYNCRHLATANTQQRSLILFIRPTSAHEGLYVNVGTHSVTLALATYNYNYHPQARPLPSKGGFHSLHGGLLS